MAAPRVLLGPFSLERAVSAVEKVRERLLRATAALENADLDYAVAGGNAVAAWVTRVDEAAVRNTRDVDILLRRTDLNAAKTALENAGLSVFVHGPDAEKSVTLFHIVLQCEKVRAARSLAHILTSPNP
jgi:hypothetical protein